MNDFAQQVMEQVPCGLDKMKVHLDVIGIFCKTCEEHLLVTGDKMVSSCLEANGFTIIPLKCEWTNQKTN